MLATRHFEHAARLIYFGQRRVRLETRHSEKRRVASTRWKNRYPFKLSTCNLKVTSQILRHDLDRSWGADTRRLGRRGASAPSTWTLPACLALRTDSCLRVGDAHAGSIPIPTTTTPASVACVADVSSTRVALRDAEGERVWGEEVLRLRDREEGVG